MPQFDKMQKPIAPADPVVSKPSPLRLLILEDREADAELMLHELRKIGFEPEWQRVETESDFLTAVKAKPDLILADWSLPQYSGLRALQFLNEQGLDFPFIIVSGRVDEEAAVEAMKQGAADYVIKDRMARLGQSVMHALQAKRLRDEKQQDEQRLKESEMRFRTLFEQTAVGVALVETKTGKYVEINQEYCDFLGYSKEEMLHRSIQDVTCPDDIQTSLQNIFLLINGKIKEFFVEKRYIRKDGKVVWGNLTVSPLWKPGETPQTYLHIAVVQDITDRKQAEEMLEESEKKYHSLFKEASIGIFQSLPEGRFLQVNPAMAAILGYESPEEVLALVTDISTQIYVDSNSKSRDEIVAALKQDDWFYGENQYRRKDGRIRTANVSVRKALHPDGTLAYLEGFVEDITERTQAEKAREAIFEISQAAINSMDLVTFYANIHQILGKLIPLQNFYIMLYDQATNLVSFPYFVDQFDSSEPPQKPGRGVSEYILRTGKSVHVTEEVFNELIARKEIDSVGTPSIDWFGVPLKVEDNVFGVMVTQSYSEKIHYCEEDLKLFEQVSFPVALSIYRKKSEEEIRLRVSQLATAREIGKSLTETLELDQIYERLYQATKNILPDSDTLLISLFEREKAEFRWVFARSEGERMDASILPPAPLEPAGRGTQSEVVHTRKPLIVGDLQAKLKKVGLVVDISKTGEKQQSGLYVPMLAKGEVIGVVITQSRKLNRYTQDDAEMLSLVANSAASAIQNAQLFTQTEKRLQQISAIHTMDTAISSSIDLELTLTILLELVTSQLGVDAADVLVLNKNSQILECLGRRGFRTHALQYTKLSFGEDLAGKAILDRKILVIEDLSEINTPFRSPELVKEGFMAYFGAPLIVKGEVIGVLELFHREIKETSKEWFDYLENLAAQAAIAIDNFMLFNNLQRSNLDLSLAYDATILGWSNALDLRDKETEGHSQRVTEMTLKLAQRMELGEDELIHVRRGSLLHDIGKMGVADSILLKAGPLTEEEWVSMHRHPLLAYNLLAPIPYLQKALEIPYCHHEKWDGTGYPRGLKGEQIPLAARIFAVVDVWDALTSDRPYRKAWTEKKALKYILEQAGKHFDPEVVNIFRLDHE